jgi:hypothetical protein
LDPHLHHPYHLHPHHHHHRLSGGGLYLVGAQPASLPLPPLSAAAAVPGRKKSYLSRLVSLPFLKSPSSASPATSTPAFGANNNNSMDKYGEEETGKAFYL